ncbi:prepilin peptidase [Patescibacteria group bacterium]
MTSLILIFLFLIGLGIGSFLNALIYRLHTGESILKGRSKCPDCQHELKWIDLIPIVSFILLKARCRYCRKPISWQYPVVEMMTGILFMLAGWVQMQSWIFWGVTFSGVMYLVFILFIIAVLILIFVYDLRHLLILDKVVFPVLVISFIAVLFLPQIPLGWALLSSGITGGFFLFLVLLSKEKWMGWGDVKLGFLIGLVIPWPQTLLLLLIAFVGGSIISLILVALKVKGMKDAVPFGTFLTAAAIVMLIWGQPVIDWYMGLLS